MIYILLFIWITVLSFLEINRVGKDAVAYHLLYLLSGIILIIVAGSRVETGYDYGEYKMLYDGLSLSNFTSKAVEIGFAALVQFFRSLGLNFNGFLFVVAMMAITLKMEYMRKNSMYLFLALLNYYVIGFLINEMGQIRHGIALAIGLYAVSDLMEDRPVSYFVKVFLGFLVHASMIIMVPAWFIARWKGLNARWMVLTLLPFTAFIFIDIRQALFNILNYVPFFQIQAKMVFYIYSDEFGKSLGINISFLLRVLTFALMIIFVKPGTYWKPAFERLTRLYYFGIVLYMFFNSIAEFAIRTSTYFRILDVLILPFFVSLGKTRLEKNLIAFFIVSYCFYSMYKVVYGVGNESPYLPYDSVIQQWFYK